MFRRLRRDNNEQFIRLLLHTEVPWLSKGTSLSRFVALCDSAIQFTITLRLDIFKRFNETNLQLQGANIIFISCNNIVSLFKDIYAGI